MEDCMLNKMNLKIITLLFSFGVFSAQSSSLVENRIHDEMSIGDKPFVLLPHKINYLMPITYSTSPNTKIYQQAFGSNDYKTNKTESEFQISIKIPLWNNLITKNDSLYFGYTNHSFWQSYNKRTSFPFREINHEPELFWTFKNNISQIKQRIPRLGIGISHQSNGRSGILSRSWNRIYGVAIVDMGPLVFVTKAWWRIPENKKKHVGAVMGDDNPEIIHFMGNVEVTGIYAFKQHRVTVKIRDNLNFSDNKGALNLTYSYPLMNNLRFYVQYFNGYGESLIDYNHRNQRIGIGFSINDLL